MTVDFDTRAFKVHGRVQGVGFRWWVHQHARSLGLKGTVRNCLDGTVEVAFSGSAAAAHRMTQLLQACPAPAHVDHLEQLPAPDDLPDDFQITF